jgi:hypothetical protein
MTNQLFFSKTVSARNIFKLLLFFKNNLLLTVLEAIIKGLASQEGFIFCFFLSQDLAM